MKILILINFHTDLGFILVQKETKIQQVPKGSKATYFLLIKMLPIDRFIIYEKLLCQVNIGLVLADKIFEKRK